MICGAKDCRNKPILIAYGKKEDPLSLDNFLVCAFHAIQLKLHIWFDVTSHYHCFVTTSGNSCGLFTHDRIFKFEKIRRMKNAT